MPSNATQEEVQAARMKKLYELDISEIDILLIEMQKTGKVGEEPKWTFVQKTSD